MIPLSALSRHVTDSLHASLLDLRVPSMGDASTRGVALLSWAQGATSLLEQLLVASEMARPDGPLGASLHAAEAAAEAERHEIAEYQAALNDVGGLAREATFLVGGGRAPVRRAIDVAVHGAFRGLPLAVDPAWAVAHSLLGDATRTLAQAALFAREPPVLPEVATSDKDTTAALSRRAARQTLEESVQTASWAFGGARARRRPRLELLQNSGGVDIVIPGSLRASLSLLHGRAQWENWFVTDVLPEGKEENEDEDEGSLWLAGGAHTLEYVGGLSSVAQAAAAAAPSSSGLTHVLSLLGNFSLDMALDSLFKQAAALAATGAESTRGGALRIGRWAEGRLRARLLRAPRMLLLSAWPITPPPMRLSDSIGDALLADFDRSSNGDGGSSGSSRRSGSDRLIPPHNAFVAIDDRGIPFSLPMSLDRLVASPAWTALCSDKVCMGDLLLTASLHENVDKDDDDADKRRTRQERIANGNGLVLHGESAVALATPTDTFSALTAATASAASGSALLCQLAAALTTAAVSSSSSSSSVTAATSLPVPLPSLPWPHANPSFAAALTHVCSPWVAGVGLDHTLSLGANAAQVTIEVFVSGADARGRSDWYKSAIDLRQAKFSSAESATYKKEDAEADDSDVFDAVQPALMWRSLIGGTPHSAPTTLAEPALGDIISSALGSAALDSLRLAASVLKARHDLSDSIAGATIDVYPAPLIGPSGLSDAILRVSWGRGVSRAALIVTVDANSGDLRFHSLGGSGGGSGGSEPAEGCTSRVVAAAERRTIAALRNRFNDLHDTLIIVEQLQREAIEEGLLTAGLGNTDDSILPVVAAAISTRALDAALLSRLSVRTGCLAIIQQGATTAPSDENGDSSWPNVPNVVMAATTSSATTELIDPSHRLSSSITPTSAPSAQLLADPLAASRDHISGAVLALSAQHFGDVAAILLSPSHIRMKDVAVAASGLARAALLGPGDNGSVIVAKLALAEIGIVSTEVPLRSFGPALQQADAALRAAFPPVSVFHAAREAIDVLCGGARVDLSAPSVATALAGAVVAKMQAARAVVLAESIAALLNALAAAEEADATKKQFGALQTMLISTHRPRWLLPPGMFSNAPPNIFSLSSTAVPLSLPKSNLFNVEAWLLVPHPRKESKSRDGKGIVVIATRGAPLLGRIGLSWLNATAGVAVPPSPGLADIAVLAAGSSVFTAAPAAAPAIWATPDAVARANAGRKAFFSLPTTATPPRTPLLGPHVILVDISASALASCAPAVCIRGSGVSERGVFRALQRGLTSLRTEATGAGAIGLVALISTNEASIAEASHAASVALSLLPLPPTHCPVILVVGAHAAAMIRNAVSPIDTASAAAAPVVPVVVVPVRKSGSVRSLFGGRAIPGIGAAPPPRTSMQGGSTIPPPMLSICMTVEKQQQTLKTTSMPAIILAMAHVDDDKSTSLVEGVSAATTTTISSGVGLKRGRQEAHIDDSTTTTTNTKSQLFAVAQGIAQGAFNDFWGGSGE